MKIDPKILLTTDRKLVQTNQILMLDLVFDQGSRSNRVQIGWNFPKLMITHIMLRIFRVVSDMKRHTLNIFFHIIKSEYATFEKWPPIIY